MTKYEERLAERTEAHYIVGLAAAEAKYKGWITSYAVNQFRDVQMDNEKMLMSYYISYDGEWWLSVISFDDFEPKQMMIVPEKAARLIRTMPPEQIRDYIMEAKA